MATLGVTWCNMVYMVYMVYMVDMVDMVYMVDNMAPSVPLVQCTLDPELGQCPVGTVDSVFYTPSNGYVHHDTNLSSSSFCLLQNTGSTDIL